MTTIEEPIEEENTSFESEGENEQAQEREDKRQPAQTSGTTEDDQKQPIQQEKGPEDEKAREPHYHNVGSGVEQNPTTVGVVREFHL